MNNEINRKSKRASFRPIDDRESAPNKRRRTVSHVVVALVDLLMKRTERYNAASKQLVLQRFWSHPSLRAFQPIAFGCPKLDASILAGITNMTSSLQVVKFVRRKDHLVAKQMILTVVSGPNIVGKRYKIALERALGIKRHKFLNLCKRDC